MLDVILYGIDKSKDSLVIITVCFITILINRMECVMFFLVSVLDQYLEINTFQLYTFNSILLHKN